MERRRPARYLSRMSERGPSCGKDKRAKPRKDVWERAVTGCLVLRPGESDQGWCARRVRRESVWTYPDVLRRRASSDLTTNSVTCLSLIGEGFSREREWLPAGPPRGDPSARVRPSTWLRRTDVRECVPSYPRGNPCGGRSPARAGAVFLGEAPDRVGLQSYACPARQSGPVRRSVGNRSCAHAGVRRRRKGRGGLLGRCDFAHCMLRWQSGQRSRCRETRKRGYTRNSREGVLPVTT
jgi:hypothetical protein